MGSWNLEEQAEPTVPALFKAVDGLAFWSGTGKAEEAFILRAGAYVGSKGAIVVWTDAGECECKLTVNLDVQGLAMQPHEFFVKIAERGHVHETLLRLGVFSNTRRYVSQGYQGEYADIWEFGQCSCGSGGFMIECVACRLRLTTLFEDRKTARCAADTVQRLKSRRAGDW